MLRHFVRPKAAQATASLATPDMFAEPALYEPDAEPRGPTLVLAVGPLKARAVRRGQRVAMVPNLKLMSNSERGKYYRRRKKQYVTELEQQVAELREQVSSLVISRQVQRELSLSAMRTPEGSAAKLVAEYCAQFSQGTPVRLSVDEHDASATLVAKATATQSGFVHAFMEPNTRFGEFQGIDLLLDQWQRYSIFHSAIHWQLKSLEVVNDSQSASGEDPPVIISIHADLTLRFSRRTIEEIYPHLLPDEEFVKSLIGLEITYPCINRFHFNDRGKVECYEPEVEFVSAMLKAFGSIEQVNRVLGHALIAKDHMIGDYNDEAIAPLLENRGVQIPTDEQGADNDDLAEGLTSPSTSSESMNSPCMDDEDLECSVKVSDSPGPMDLAFILD